jgi:hypothetical protein
MTQFNRLVLTASPKTTRKSLSTFVDAALPLDERGKRFGARLVLRCITEHARPLGSRPLVDFLLSKISSHPAKFRTLRLTAFDMVDGARSRHRGAIE